FAVLALDQRPVGARPARAERLRQDGGDSRPHAPDGWQHAPAATAHASPGRPDAAADDDVHAARVYLHVHQPTGRTGSLLAGEQRHHHRPAVRDDALALTRGSACSRSNVKGKPSTRRSRTPSTSWALPATASRWRYWRTRREVCSASGPSALGFGPGC